jgi:hypothetical protein
MSALEPSSPGNVTLNSRPITSSDSDWLSTLESILPLDAWRQSTAAMHNPRAFYLDDQPIAAIGMGRVDFFNQIAYLFLARDNVFKDSVPLALQAYALDAFRRADIRHLYIEWLETVAAPAGLMEFCLPQGRLVGHLFRSGGYVDVSIWLARRQLLD